MSRDDPNKDCEMRDKDGERGIAAPEVKEVEKQLASEEVQYTKGVKLWIILTGVTLVFFVVLLDLAILSTATPKITSDFHSLTDVGWYGAAYLLASATLQPLTGKVYSNFSYKWTFFTFFLVFELGSLLCGVAVSSKMLIVGRAVAGMGASGLQNGALTIITSCAPGPKRPQLLGIMIGIGQLGVVAGPLIGGVLTEYVSWRWCFYINLPIGGAIALLLGFLRIPEQVSKPPLAVVVRDLHHKLDLIGFVLFAPATIMLLLAVQCGGNQYPWNGSVVIGLFGGAGANFLIWLAWDYYKADAALIPLGMLKKQYVWSSCLVTAFFSSAMFMTSYYLPIYFQSVRGKSPAISGVYLLPSVLSQLLGAVSSGKAVSYFGYYTPWSLASAILTAVGYGLVSTLGPTSSAGQWAGYQVLFGAGRGVGIQMPFVAVQNTLPQKQIPLAMSLLTFSQTLTGALFLTLADTVFTNSLQSLLRQDAPGVDPEAVIEAGAGASGFRDLVTPAELANVLGAYAESVSRVFYMCAALAAACFVLSWAMGWVDVRKERTAEEGESRD